MPEVSLDLTRKNRWYFGGLAASLALFFTHPFDLIKVTNQLKHGQNEKLTEILQQISKNKGIFGIYNGLTAAITRQMTYSLTRFGAYDYGSHYISTDTFYGKMGLSAISGSLGGFVGSPADMINVRMQNDAKLPFEQRRNYRNVFDGFSQVYRHEGFRSLFSGATMAMSRGILMTVGQIAFYQEIKERLIKTGYFEDDMKTYGVASFLCGIICTYLSQPVDVVKTRYMNSPGKYNNNWHVFLETAKEGPLAFFKGSYYALIRPQTLVTILIMEELRIYFGTKHDPE